MTTGEHENSVCPTCGGPLQNQISVIPFLPKPNAVVVIKGVPAEVCAIVMSLSWLARQWTRSLESYANFGR